MDQISEGGRSIHEIDKICKRLDAEKMELEAALSEAEGALEQEENKVGGNIEGGVKHTNCSGAKSST